LRTIDPVSLPGRRPGGILRRWLVLAVALAVGSAACGGGGGGGGGPNPTPSPVPTIPVVTATPGPGPTPTPTPVVSNVSLLLREGDVAPGGATVADIEDAALADDGSVAAIIEIAGSQGSRGVIRRIATGDFATVFSPQDDPTLDSSTLEEVLVAPGGRVLFQSEVGLDGDRLYLAANGATQAIAGAPPGVVATTFRILGEFEIGGTNLVGFVGGGSPCTVETQGETVRVRCQAHLFVASGFDVEEVELDDIDLSDQSTSTPQVSIAPTGAVFFSVPGGGEEPTIVRVENGTSTTVLSADEEVDPVGRLNRPQLNAANRDEDLLVTTTLAEDPPPTRPAVIGVLHGGDFDVVARESLAKGPDDVTDLRSVGLDDFGDVLFTATLGTADSPDGARRSLRLYDGTDVNEIVTEGSTFPGTDLTLLSIGSARFNASGDVAFVAELGRRMPGTVVVEEARAVLRRLDGALRTVVSTNDGAPIGALSDLEIAGLAADGSLLIVAQAEPSGDRVLLYAAPPRS
jgi:hypothetical protein